MAEQSFDDRRKLVETALHSQWGTSAWISELWDDRLIYQDYENEPDKLWEVPYSLDGDNVAFGARTAVVREVSYRALKFVGPDTIEGPAFLFNADLVGERFTADTDFCIEWFGKSGRPLLYEHGIDPALKAGIIGRQVDYDLRDEGIWAQSQLNANVRYRKAIDGLIEQGALSYSGGAMQHLATKGGGGAIQRFPWVELSLTPTPMNPENAGVYYIKSAEAIAHLLAVDVPLPDPLKAALSALDEWAESRDPDALPDGASFADVVVRQLDDVKARVDARKAWNAKSGHKLSVASRERLLNHPVQLRELADDLDALLATAAAVKSAGGSVDLWAQQIAAEAAFARLLGVPLPERGEPSHVG